MGQLAILRTVCSFLAVCATYNELILLIYRPCRPTALVLPA